MRRNPRDAPLDPDAAAELIPDITNSRALDRWEGDNVREGRVWALANKRTHDYRHILEAKFVRTLHRKMFGKTWRWAGKLRSTDTNIGRPWEHISTDLQNLLEDAKAQVGSGAYPPDELAMRFHHRLVFIHPFANGNGRHARLMADLLVRSLGKPMFSWSSGKFAAQEERRRIYLDALLIADREKDFAPLLRFARG